jgi:hypothetical protein
MSSMTAAPVKIATERPEPPSPPVSFEDYLAWSLNEDIHAEWVDGEIVPMAPSNVDHHDLNGWLYHLVLGEDGRYHRAPVDPEGVYHPAMLPGFWLRVEWLWQRPLPEVSEVLPQIEA